MSNPVDNTYAVIKEVVKGVTPPAPAFNSADVTTGGATLTFNMTDLNSETMKQSRDMAGIRKVAGSGSGSLKFELRRDPVITDFLAAAFSAVKDGNSYKGSNKDTSFTIEETMTVDAGKLYFRHKNAHVSKATITVDAESKAQVSFDFVNGSFEHGTAPVTGATYVKTVKGQELVGRDVGTINIAGLTARYMSLEISVEQAREPNYALGERDAFEIGTSANRIVKVTAKLFRKDLNPETLFNDDTPVAFSANLGEGADGYGFNFPSCVGSFPTNETNGSKQLVTVVLTAQYDPTADYAAMFTELA